MHHRINQQWRLVARPEGHIKESDFAWYEAAVPDLEQGEVLVRTIYLSLDPSTRAWMGERATYLPPLALGDVMRGVALGVVEESRNERFEPGDYVTGMLGWQTYYVGSGRGLAKIQQHPGLPLDAHMSLLGAIGATAYFGLLEIGQPQEGETLVVSAAAGAVGCLVGQIGKIKGCRVIGTAGTDEKCHYLINELGFDGAINYKTDSLSQGLKKFAPDGVDVHFENVGGKVLDAVLARINLYARIVLCGLISQYNSTEPVPGPYNLVNLLVRRGRMQGFIVLDYAKRFAESDAALTGWYSAGKITYRSDIVDGLGQAATAVNKLFDGSKQGKLLIKVSDPGQ